MLLVKISTRWRIHFFKRDSVHFAQGELPVPISDENGWDAYEVGLEVPFFSLLFIVVGGIAVLELVFEGYHGWRKRSHYDEDIFSVLSSIKLSDVFS